MSKKHLIAIGTVILLLVVGLSGCNEISNPLSSEADRFVGTWNDEKYNNETITFFSDGEWVRSGVMGSGITGDYEIKNGKLVIYYTIEENTFSNVYDYTFSDNDTTLTLTTTDGDDMVYTKQ